MTPTYNYITATLGTGYSFSSSAIAMSGGVGLYVDGGWEGVTPFYSGGDTVNLPLTTWYEGAIGLVVLRLDFNLNALGPDTMGVWLNPALGVNPGPAQYTFSGANFGGLLNGLTLSWGDYRAFVIDEVRIGETFEAVTPFH